MMWTPRYFKSRFLVESSDNDEDNDLMGADLMLVATWMISNSDLPTYTDPFVLETCCHYQKRNVWWGRLIKYTTALFCDDLVGSLDVIESGLHVALSYFPLPSTSWCDVWRARFTLHTLAEHDWSVKKISTAIDRLCNALGELEKK